MLFKYLPFKLYQQYSEQTILATAFYLSGYYMKKECGIINRSYFGITLFIPLIITTFFWHKGMAGSQGAKGLSILPYYILAISGTIALITFSAYINGRKAGRLFAYIGDKTLYILTFHFLAFKMVSFFYLYFNGLPIGRLTEFPVLSNVPIWMSLVYTLVGVILPILLWKIIKRLSVKVS